MPPCFSRPPDSIHSTLAVLVCGSTGTSAGLVSKGQGQPPSPAITVVVAGLPPRSLSVFRVDSTPRLRLPHVLPAFVTVLRILVMLVYNEVSFLALVDPLLLQLYSVPLNGWKLWIVIFVRRGTCRVVEIATNGVSFHRNF